MDIGYYSFFFSFDLQFSKYREEDPVVDAGSPVNWLVWNALFFLLNPRRKEVNYIRER